MHKHLVYLCVARVDRGMPVCLSLIMGAQFCSGLVTQDSTLVNYMHPISLQVAFTIPRLNTNGKLNLREARTLRKNNAVCCCWNKYQGMALKYTLTDQEKND